MNNLDVTAGHAWHPFAWLGLTHPFFTIGHDEVHMIVQTWIILVILFLLCLPIRWLLKNRYGIARYIILSGVNTMIGLCKQAMGTLIFKHLAFVTSIFLFILLCNIITIFPWMEEPTQNINTTLALSITSFLYVQYQGIRAHGIKGYLKEYTEPFFIMAPLHIISKVASIVSMAFRLFGNIFGGAMITSLYMALIKRSLIFELIGLGLGLNFLILFFFGLFEGFLQAFVFTMLSLTYLSIAIAHEEEPTKEAA
jgi:F-type H+-transporting ATPase subunit a